MSTILVDMDGILVDLVPYWLDALNDDHGLRVFPERITKWDLHECIPDLAPETVYKYVSEYAFMRRAPVMPGAQAAIRELQRMHDVYVLSAPSGAQCARAKIEWLKEYFPSIDQRHIILGHHKHMVRGDVLIDDKPETIRQYRQTWPQARVTGIEWPYNRGLGLASDWEDPATAWERIVQAVL